MKHPISSYEKLNINIPKQTNLEKKLLYVQHLYVMFIYNIKNIKIQN
jgi:hypothetical protein